MRISFIILLLFLVSCEENISSKFSEDMGNWFAISGRITGGTHPSIHVSETVNMIELDSVKQVGDALVEGLVDGQPVLFTHATEGVFICEKTIVEPGDSIRIICSGRDLPDASVSLMIPELPQLSDLAWYVDEEYVLHVEALLTDPPGQSDYYSIRSSGIQKYSKRIYGSDSTYRLEYLAEGYYYGYGFPDSLAEYSTGSGRSFNDNSKQKINGGGIIYFSDRLFDGASKHLSMNLSLIHTWNDSIPEITVHFAKNDIHLFNFIESYIRYEPDPDIEILQPSRIYTNIENGFGLLTAESKITEVIDLSDVYSDPEFIAYRDSAMKY